MSNARDDFYTLISTAAAPCLVIYSDQNGKAPARPYITLSVQVGRPGPSHHGPVNNDGIRIISSHRPVSIQLQCYGADSLEILDRLQLALQREAIQELSEQLNISTLRPVRLQPVPALVEGVTYEPRAILDLESMYTASIEDNVGVIESVEITMDTSPGESSPRTFMTLLP